MADKTFILGLGAQKAGTSWLYRYLEACPQVDFGLMKEYHVWDVRQSPASFPHFRVDEERLVQQRATPRFPMLQLRYAMQNFDGFYGFYFENLLRQSGKTITGDITPSYSALTVETLKTIRDELTARGFDIRVVFLMRDPVERIWSAVRMKRRIRLNNTPVTLADLPPEAEEVAETFATPGAEARGRYDHTIANIEAVFDKNRVYYGFFETLFSEPVLRDLADFLGVPVLAERLETKVNVSEKNAPLPTDLHQRIRDHYAPVYAFCHDRFPDTRALWG